MTARGSGPTSRRAVLAGLVGIGVAGTAAIAPADRYDGGPGSMMRALDAGPETVLHFPGGTVAVVFADGAPGLDRGPVLAWIRRAAQATIAYFGRFPLRRYRLLVIAGDGDRIGHATTFGFVGSATRIHVGRDTATAAFDDDWVLVHEMMHAALPDLPRNALWVQEGNATWIEPIARAEAGQLSAEEVWREAWVGLPKGLPQPGDGGMDGTDVWRRLYWGGACFWFAAEIAAYEASAGRALLRDALRAINRASGGDAVTWTPEQMMTAGDRAIGAVALVPLYTRFATTAVALDLPGMMARLGVVPADDGRVALRDDAPLAALRRRMLAR